jgi:hypothetical protein
MAIAMIRARPEPKASLARYLACQVEPYTLTHSSVHTAKAITFTTVIGSISLLVYSTYTQIFCSGATVEIGQERSITVENGIERSGIVRS